MRGRKLLVDPALGFQFLYCLIAVFRLFLASIRILPPLTELFLKFLNKNRAELWLLLFVTLQICFYFLQENNHQVKEECCRAK